ncbi:hypothetical protein ACIP3A_18505 [Streptomyces tricolor]|uniref:hypothetical protein n=1 Tax=Streptomyces tricolor TaxID=68277 RepID=UPI0038138B0C
MRQEPKALELFQEAHVPEAAGIYELLQHGTSVYLGRADRSLRRRISQARWKLSGRLRISVEDMAYRFVPMDASLVDMAPERLVIQEGEYPWNRNGFGIKDPGRQRDRAELNHEHFDLQYPIDLGWTFPHEIKAETLPQLLQSVRDALPYGFRYERVAASEEALNFRIEGRTPAREAFAALVDGPLLGWQITAKPGHVIGYKESFDYPQALEVFR